MQETPGEMNDVGYLQENSADEADLELLAQNCPPGLRANPLGPSPMRQVYLFPARPGAAYLQPRRVWPNHALPVATSIGGSADFRSLAPSHRRVPTEYLPLLSNNPIDRDGFKFIDLADPALVIALRKIGVSIASRRRVGPIAALLLVFQTGRRLEPRRVAVIWVVVGIDGFPRRRILGPQHVAQVLLGRAKYQIVDNHCYQNEFNCQRKKATCY